MGIKLDVAGFMQLILLNTVFVWLDALEPGVYTYSLVISTNVFNVDRDDSSVEDRAIVATVINTD
ncbi:hypothetical protein [Cytobacillus praedii]|uniref:hypothetical protein n=1 Tax=Cytobacillus praedii TaxID=1742358 RepID=UPI003AF4AD55